jgi:ribosomal protein L11 methyltransferase
MPFLQLTIELGAADPAPLEDALFSAGASSVTLRDAADDPILEPGPGETPLWPTVTVCALFNDLSRDEIAQRVVSAFGATLPSHRFEQIEDRIWEREWLKDFRPMQFGKRLWVCPDGLRPDVTDCVVIDLDPGLAFGTGTHPTTALCLEWLDQASLSGKRVIDYGCGSGILAIAALKLGASSAVGIDNDPQALIATHDNASRNGVDAQLTVQIHTAPLPNKCDVLLANILAGPLHELAPTLAQLVNNGGDLVLSGILAEQAAALSERYSTWFDMQAPTIRADWARLVGTRLVGTKPAMT